MSFLTVAGRLRGRPIRTREGRRADLRSGDTDCLRLLGLQVRTIWMRLRLPFSHRSLVPNRPRLGRPVMAASIRLVRRNLPQTSRLSYATTYYLARDGGRVQSHSG
jgi:hypothetical protein